MGAWLAIAGADEGLIEPVLESLRTSLGDLTSPPLATAAVVLAGSDALGSLHAFAGSASGWHGAPGFIAAAIELLGGTPVHAIASARDRQELAEMLRIASALAPAGWRA